MTRSPAGSNARVRHPLVLASCAALVAAVGLGYPAVELWRERALRSAAEQALRAGRSRDALAAYHALLRRHPRDVSIVRPFALCALENGEIDAALDALGGVGERGPELMRLPKGSSIASNYESRQMVKAQKIVEPQLERRQMVNPAGSGRASSSKSGFSIGGNFIDKIVIEGGSKDPQQIAEVVIDRLHEVMRQAKEISGSADMGVLLA